MRKRIVQNRNDQRKKIGERKEKLQGGPFRERKLWVLGVYPSIAGSLL